MSRLARLAVGTMQPSADSAVMIWGFMEAIERAGLRVQSFLSRACFTPVDGAASITGQPPRHLDSWLMTPDLCREFFLRGCQDSDLAIVEGRFESARSEPQALGGNLDTLCRWLELPRLAIVDVSRLSACQVPERPEGIQGLLLDRVADQAQLNRKQTMFESLWGVPVLGSLPALPALRAQIESLPAGSKPPREICQTLGQHFAGRAKLERIIGLATQREFPLPPATASVKSRGGQAVRVAVAFDDAFHCYFPDTLDMLELHGASIQDFSPLHDERLPRGTDVVYLGCGRADLHAARLAENHCMMLALRNHLCGGGRIYAEGGGLAYLCQRAELPDGELLPMAGILPAVARLNDHLLPPQPTEITLAEGNWLGPLGTRLRGYLNSRWQLEPTGPLRRCAASAGQALDLVRYHQAIGSRVHLNFAVQAHALESFFVPHAATGDGSHFPLARSV